MKANYKFTKKLLAILLSLFVVAGVMPIGLLNVSAAASSFTITIDTGVLVTLTDSDGDDYYEIDTADELYAFAAKINSNSRSIKGKLMADITVNSNLLDKLKNTTVDTSGIRAWIPIGDVYYHPLNGVLDGNGKTISGLYFSDVSKVYVGFVGTMGENGIVKNLKVADSYFCGDYGVGGIVGQNKESSSIVENCSISNSIVEGNNKFGGIVGINAGTVRNCYSTIDFTGEACYIGGVVGDNSAIIENCYNTGNIEGNYYLGGIVGRGYSGSVKNCYNTGNIKGSSYGIGGVVGTNTGAVDNCYNIGSVEGGYDFGNIFGMNYSTQGGSINNSYYLSSTDDGNGGKTAEQFASGEVAYLLQNGEATQVWGQNIDNGKTKEDTPVFSDAIVNYGYHTVSCEEISPYTNKTVVTTERLEHSYLGEKCTVCKKVCVHPDAKKYTDNYDELTHSRICPECKFVLETDGHNHINGICDSCGNKKNFTITVPETVQGGKITADKEIANVGDTVTLTIKPDNGFELKDVRVTYGDGINVDFSDNQFTMPADDVTVDAVFSQICYHYGNADTGDDYDTHSFTCVHCKAVITAEEHYGGTATCHELAVCSVCGDEYDYLDYYNHTGPYTEKFSWYPENENDSCYVNAHLFCEGCNGAISHSSGYATKSSFIAAKDCLNPGSVTWTISVELNGEEYTASETFEIKSNKHVGTLTNGFCSSCGGFETATDSNDDGYYEIDNAGKLFWFADYINNVSNELNAVVTKNITVPNGKEWTPIMNFYGTFDGNGKTISGLQCTTENDYVGFFGGGGYSRGSIKNVHLTNSSFVGLGYVGGIAGYHEGEIKNCFVDSTVIVIGDHSVGALVGHNGGFVQNCYAYASNAVGYYNSDYSAVENVYYLSETDDGNGGKTAAQFASGEVAYLLQSGVLPEDIYDEDWNYIETITPEIWGQNIGSDKYPVLGGTTVYKVLACDNKTETYSNSDSGGQHTFENGVCTKCSAIEYDYNGDGKLNVLDLVRLKKYLADVTDDIKTEFDDNGIIETADLVKIRKTLLK